jgi:hypothetical protein
VKADLDLVKLCLQRQELDARLVASVLEDITQELQAQQEDKAPKQKMQTCILGDAGFGEMPAQGWVVKIPEGENPATILARIFSAAYQFNASPKGRRLPVRSVKEALEVIPARIFKEQGISPQTKEPVLILATDNRIPMHEGI